MRKNAQDGAGVCERTRCSDLLHHQLFSCRSLQREKRGIGGGDITADVLMRS